MRNPYITGPYVTGHNHYGREDLIQYLLSGASRAYWVIGNRRIGKTSLLRQLEMLTLAEGSHVPLFWDMQGSESCARLGQYLADATYDARRHFSRLGVSLAALLADDAPALLGLLRRSALEAGREILLLCDETEALLELAEREPDAVQRLHRALQAGPGLRVVATSTRAIYRMHDVCADWKTSPFLVGFDMSQTLGGLSPQAARDLIVQTQAPQGGAIRAAPETIAAVCEHTNHHPYLLQLLCSCLFQEDGWLRPLTADDLNVDLLLAGFFRNDFTLLTEADRRVIWTVQKAGIIDESALVRSLTGDPMEVRRWLHSLEQLGYLRRIGGQMAIGNQFLANWMSVEREALDKLPAAQTSPTAMDLALRSQDVQQSSFLIRRLNAKRGRLAELDLQRARDLLATPPQVLAEIEQTESEIRHLRQLLDELRLLEAPAT